MDAGSVIVRIMADSTALTAGLSKASGQMAGFGTKMSKVGMGMSKYLTLPIVAAGAVSIKMAADFETSMKLIQTQAGGSAADVKTLSKSVLDLATKGQHGPKELADSLYHLKSVGMSNVEAMNALKLAEQGASVGGSKLEETTNAIAGAWRTGIQGAQSFEGAMGTLNAIVGAGNLRMEDLNQALGTGILVSAKTFGVSLTSVGAALALFTSQGMPATQSATRLRMAISMMGAPTDKAAKMLKGIGIGATDMAVALRHGGIVEAVGLLKDHLQGLSKIDQSKLLSGAFGGARTGTAIMALVDGYDTLVAKQKQIVANSGKFGEAVAAQAQDASAKWHHFLAVLSVDAIQIGNIMLPMATKLAAGLGRVAAAFSNLSPFVQSFIVKLALVAAAAGPMAFLVGKAALLARALMGLRTTMLGVAAAQALMAGTGAGGGLVAAGASATTAAAGVRTFYVAASGAASTTTALATSGVSAGLAVGALGAAAAAAVVTMVALGAAALKVHSLMVKIQSDKTVPGTVAAELDEMVKGVGQAMAETTHKMATGSMSMAKGQKYMFGFIDTLRQVRKEAVKVGDAQMIAQIDQLIGGYKGLQGQFVKLGGIKFKFGAGAGIQDMHLINTAITTVKGNIAGLKDRLAVLGKMKSTPKVKAEISDLKAKLAKAEADLKKLNGMKANPKVNVNISAAKAALAKAQGELKRLNGMKSTPKVRADISAAKAAIAKAQGELKKLNGTKTNPKVTANSTSALSTIAGVILRLAAANNARANPTITANAGSALATIWSVINALAQVHDKTVTVTTRAGGKVVAHSGGVFSGSSTGYPAILHGREAVLPLEHPGLIPGILARAGIGSGTAGRSSPGAVTTKTINVNVVVPGGTTLIGTAREVGEIIAPHVARALDRTDARHGRGR